MLREKKHNETFPQSPQAPSCEKAFKALRKQTVIIGLSVLL